MLKGELVYIRHEHRSGIGKTSGEPYEFANVTLSDGLESIKLNIDLQIVPMFEGFKKGEKIAITVDLIEAFNRLDLLIVDVALFENKKVS